MKKILLFLISLTVIFSFSEVVCCAEDGETDDMSFALQEDIIDKCFCEVKKLSEEKKSDEIECFAVSEQGNVAVGMGEMYSGISDNILNIYDKNNQYMCGYQIYSNGIYALEWENDNLFIYFLRCNAAILLSMDGDIINTYTIKPDNNYYEIGEKLAQRESLKKNGFIYQLKYSFGNANKLLKCSDNYKSVIVDTTELMKTQRINTLIMYFAFFSLTVVILIICQLKFIRQKNKK